MVSSDNRKNAEGYLDPTAYTALTNIGKEEQKIKLLKKILGEICMLSGYRLKGQIMLINKKTGHSYRL